MNKIPPLISIGSADAATVFIAQRNLNVADARELSGGRAGLDACPLTEDGVFDARMQQAAIDFQTRGGLAVDGIIGPNTWGQLLQGVNPDSAVASGTAAPIEGGPRWSVSLDDISAATGTAPTAAQLSGVTVTVGGAPAANPAVSPDGLLIYFTLPIGSAGGADLTLTASDGTSFTLPQAVLYTTAFPLALEGVVVATAVAIQEAALSANAQQVGRLQSFVDALSTALFDCQDVLTQLVARFQDPAAPPTLEDGEAWLGHMACRARLTAHIINEQCRIGLGTDPIAEPDGMPFGGADDQPTLDTGATVLLMTASENIVVPSFVDLTA